MSSCAAASGSVRATSRPPPWQTVWVDRISQIVSVGDARDRAAGTTSQAPQGTTAGQIVQAERPGAIPLGSGEDSFDVDQKIWDDAVGGAAGGDVLVEYARYASRVGVPTPGVIADLPQAPKTPERQSGTQSSTEQGRRTRSPRSALRTMMAAGRPPMEQLVQAFTSSPQ